MDRARHTYWPGSRIISQQLNFLAHQYLSGENEALRFGNFIADFVKGNKFLNYEKDIQLGILYHREIDWFTDNHSITRESTSLLRNDFGKYAGVALDVYFDHFLSKNWSEYSKIALKDYTRSTYAIVNANKDKCPPRALHMLRYMKRDDWLFNYQFPEAVGRSLKGISSRTNFDSGLEKGKEVLIREYDYLKSAFEIFIADIISNKSSILLNANSKYEENL